MIHSFRFVSSGVIHIASYLKKYVMNEWRYLMFYFSGGCELFLRGVRSRLRRERHWGHQWLCHPGRRRVRRAAWGGGRGPGGARIDITLQRVGRVYLWRRWQLQQRLSHWAQAECSPAGRSRDPVSLSGTTHPTDPGMADAHLIATQQTRDIHPILVECRSTVVDGGPTLNQYWVNSSCFLRKRRPIRRQGLRFVFTQWQSILLASRKQ